MGVCVVKKQWKVHSKTKPYHEAPCHPHFPPLSNPITISTPAGALVDREELRRVGPRRVALRAGALPLEPLLHTVVVVVVTAGPAGDEAPAELPTAAAAAAAARGLKRAVYAEASDGLAAGGALPVHHLLVDRDRSGGHKGPLRRDGNDSIVGHGWACSGATFLVWFVCSLTWIGEKCEMGEKKGGGSC